MAPNSSVGDEGEDAEAAARLSAAMATVCPVGGARAGRVSIALTHDCSSRGAFHSGCLTRMHQRPTGTSSGLSTMAPMRDDDDGRRRSAGSNGCSSPTNARMIGTDGLADRRAERRRTIGRQPPRRAHGDRRDVAGDEAGEAHRDRRRPERRADVEVVQQTEHEPGERALLRAARGAGGRREREHAPAG